MGAYAVRRLLSTVVVMATVGVFVFLLLRLSAGDPAAIMAGDTATPQMIAALRVQLGLDDPLPVQFYHWAASMLGGDFGTSIFTGLPVLQLITQRLEPTVSLAVLTMIVAVTLGVTFGILAAWRAGGFVDHALTGFSALGFSVPVFVIAYFLVYALALKIHWFPVQGYAPIGQGVDTWLEHLVLPTTALSLPYIAFIGRISRASMLEVLSEAYMRTAAAKGASSYAMLFNHALKNASVPILTVIGISFAYLVGGVVIIETVFNIPGIGRLVMDAIDNRDYPVIQGVLILVSGLYVLINLLVDLCYTLVDPRIRY